MNDFFAGVPLPVENDVLFSFVYGRQHSVPLMRKWHYRMQGKADGHILTWVDPKTSLEVRANVTVHSTGAIEWVLTFMNMGARPAPILEDVQAVQARIEGRRGWREPALLHRLNGSMSQADDWLPFTQEIAPGTWPKFGPNDGWSSSGACPFFALQWDGGGVITAIGWTGQWQASVAWGTKTEIRAGMKHLHLSLEPGESIRSPRIMQLWWEGDDIEEAYNRFRQTMIRHVLPRVDGGVAVPPIAHLSTAAYEWNDSNEQNTLEHLEAVKGLGFEVFWMDAYHFEGGFPAGVGNYGRPVESITPKDRFPNGIAPIADEVHAAGMDWLLWYAPELVMPGTYLDREHPEWLLSADGQRGKLFNLGHPIARLYMTQYLIDTVEQYGLDWLRIDCCPAPLPYWRAADTGPDRVGVTEIRYVEGLYKMLDDILKACPHLKIDNCDGGGRRIDLEMCKRSTPLWRTDHTTPHQEMNGDYDGGAVMMQAMIVGLNRYVPFHSCGGFSELPYYWRSGFNAGIGILEDCRGEYYPRGVMQAAIAEGKHIRKYFFGNFYPLTETTLDPAAWHVVQYHRPDFQDGMVLAFRRHESPDNNFTCDLREIDPAGMYETTWSYDYNYLVPATFLLMSGTQLQRTSVGIMGCPGSVLVEYRRIDDDVS